jgi:AraC family transcriptional regulator, transcriptional activator of pobA
MAKQSKIKETPLYMLDAFSQKAKDSAFYIEAMETHLQNHQFISKPHKHDFYLLLYITKGTGTHIIDFKHYPISPGCFFLMTPGQVHSWTLDPGIDGFIIFFHPSFYKMHAMDNNLVMFSFFHSLNANPLVQLDEENQKTIDFLIFNMYKEFGSDQKIDLRILRSYLEIILLKLSRNYPLEINQDQANGTTYKIRQLEQLIEKHFVKKKLPREYADLMNLSPSYLNSFCKERVGKTLTDLISDRIILEAKRLFSYSDLNVNQVGQRLNFSGSSYFIRFFRKHTGLTPEQFKESLNRAS